MYNVSVKENYRWTNAKVGGIRFTKKVSEIGDSRMSDEIKKSPLLTVVKVKGETKAEAKAKAEKEAEVKAKAEKEAAKVKIKPKAKP